MGRLMRSEADRSWIAAFRRLPGRRSGSMSFRVVRGALLFFLALVYCGSRPALAEEDLIHCVKPRLSWRLDGTTADPERTLRLAVHIAPAEWSAQGTVEFRVPSDIPSGNVQRGVIPFSVRGDTLHVSVKVLADGSRDFQFKAPLLLHDRYDYLVTLTASYTIPKLASPEPGPLPISVRGPASSPTAVLELKPTIDSQQVADGSMASVQVNATGWTLRESAPTQVSLGSGGGVRTLTVNVSRPPRTTGDYFFSPSQGGKVAVEMSVTDRRGRTLLFHSDTVAISPQSVPLAPYIVVLLGVAAVVALGFRKLGGRKGSGRLAGGQRHRAESDRTPESSTPQGRGIAPVGAQAQPGSGGIRLIPDPDAQRNPASHPAPAAQDAGPGSANPRSSETVPWVPAGPSAPDAAPTPPAVAIPGAVMDPSDKPRIGADVGRPVHVTDASAPKPEPPASDEPDVADELRPFIVFGDPEPPFAEPQAAPPTAGWPAPAPPPAVLPAPTPAAAQEAPEPQEEEVPFDQELLNLLNAAMASCGSPGATWEGGDATARERRFLASWDAVCVALRAASRQERGEIVHIEAQTFLDRDAKTDGVEIHRGVKLSGDESQPAVCPGCQQELSAHELPQLFMLLELEGSNEAFLIPPSFGEYFAPRYAKCYRRLAKNEVEEGIVRGIVEPATLRGALAARKRLYVVTRRMELEIET